MNLLSSKQAFERSCAVIPGGVNSPVRAFKGVGGNPVFMASGSGATVSDIDGNSYIDYVGSWGPLILGHAHPAVVSAIKETAEKGTSFGTPTERETELAECIKEIMPSMEMVRFVNSGTEATMSAVRLARGYTRRERIIKFDGCYHGHADSFLIAAGSGAATLGIPDSPGVTAGTAKDTLLARYNDLESVRQLFSSHKDQIAAVIIEPVVGNMGVILPRGDFLKELRELTLREGTLLIFDEVMTGFRVSAGGAQELYGITPDLSTLGKIIGAGLPVGAYGGNRDIMSQIAPSGPVYQAGTLSGNPLAVAAGLAALKTIRESDDFYSSLEKRSSTLFGALHSHCRKIGIPTVLNRVGSMSTLFFTKESAVVDAASARKAHTALYAEFFHNLLHRGVYIAPSQFEASFVSYAHSSSEIEKTVEAAIDSLNALKESAPFKSWMQ